MCSTLATLRMANIFGAFATTLPEEGEGMFINMDRKWYRNDDLSNTLSNLKKQYGGQGLLIIILLIKCNNSFRWLFPMKSN